MNKGMKHSEETKIKISESRSGIESWNKGGCLTEEHKHKLSKSKTGKPINRKQVTCDVCGSTGSSNLMNRYHF